MSAVDFLHTRSILHRDIKDENIIIDHKCGKICWNDLPYNPCFRFSCKLVDFGSAVFFKPGQRFHTFYGTVEYCSPEVLQVGFFENMLYWLSQFLGMFLWGPWVRAVESGSTPVHHYIWRESVLWLSGTDTIYIWKFHTSSNLVTTFLGHNTSWVASSTQWRLTQMLGAYPGIRIISVEFWTPLNLGLLFQALLDKNPEHRASLWHLKEHEWILQEVKRYKNQNWSNVNFHQVDASQYQLYDVIPCSESELRPPTHYRYQCFVDFFTLPQGGRWKDGRKGRTSHQQKFRSREIV